MAKICHVTPCRNVKRRHIFAKVHEAQQTLWIVKDVGPNPLLGYQDVAQFVKTNGGAEKLMDSEGYVYYKKKTNSTKYFCDCVSRKKYGCRGRATTEGFMIYSRTEHNHSPPIGKFHGNMK